MKGPLHMKHIGRFAIGYWSTWRYFKWLPRRRLFWKGQLVYWSWLLFEFHIDNRTDVFGDWAGLND